MYVTIIIPNYNGINFIKTCLDSLLKQTYNDFKTIVIDNGSTDGSVNYIRENYPEIELIQLEMNYGFDRAVNVGIKHSDTPYLILLNNDTEVEQNFVFELVKSIDKSKKIFSVSSKMINFTDRTIMDDAGDLYSIIGWGFQRGVGQQVERFNKGCGIFSSCAGAAIYRREVFDIIGNFDEDFFAYLEDIDIGYRAKIFGYQNKYCPSAVVYHVGSGTSGSKYNTFKVKLSARNSIYLNYKNMPFLQLLLNLIPLMAGYIVKLIFFHRIGYGKDYLAGLKEGLRNCFKSKKVKFRLNHTYNYILIEAELILNFLLYMKAYVQRRLIK